MRLIPIQSANCGMKYLVSNVFSSQNILCQVFSLQPIDTFGGKISVGNQEVKVRFAQPCPWWVSRGNEKSRLQQIHGKYHRSDEVPPDSGVGFHVPLCFTSPN